MSALKVSNWKVGRVLPYADNARIHPEQQIAQIAASIKQFGFVNPLLVDEAGEIIAGHGRYLAARRLELETVPVIVLAGLTPEQKRALRLADNKLQDNSSFDMEKLSAELRSLQELDFDLPVIGFSDSELDALLAEADALLPSEPYSPPQQVTVTNNAPQPSPDQADQEAETVEGDAEDKHAPTPNEPRATDDEYSKFELVMLHENKLRLVDVLNQVRSQFLYEKLEDALMHILREYTK